MPRIPSGSPSSQAATLCRKLLDLHDDRPWERGRHPYVGIQIVSAVGGSGHRSIVQVPGPNSYWALYDEEEGHLTWLGESESAFDALYFLTRYRRALSSGIAEFISLLDEAADQLLEWLPGLRAFWSSWRVPVLSERVDPTELARQVPGAEALAATWALEWEGGRARPRHTVQPAEWRALAERYPTFGNAVYLFFLYGLPDERDVVSASFLLHQRAQLFGSSYTDGYKLAARVLQKTGVSEPMVVSLAESGRAVPEMFLHGARQQLSRGRHEAAANLALNAIYEALSSAEEWYEDAYTALKLAAKAGGYPDLAITYGDDSSGIGQYQPIWSPLEEDWEPPVAPGRTWVVNTRGSGDFLRISEAIASAEENDVILLRAGTYLESLQYSAKAPIRLIADASRGMVIVKSQGVPALVAAGPIAVEGVSFHTEGQWALEVSGRGVSFKECDFRSDASVGCLLSAGEASFFNCRWLGTSIQAEEKSLMLVRGGSIQDVTTTGISLLHSRGDVEGTTFERNGRALCAQDGGRLEVRACHIMDCDRFGVAAVDSSLEVVDTTLTSCRGHGIQVSGKSDASVSRCTIVSSAEFGLLAGGGTLTVESCNLERNAVGAGAYGEGALRLHETTVTQSLQGGVFVWDGGRATISGGVLMQNAEANLEVRKGGRAFARGATFRDGAQQGVFVDAESSVSLSDCRLTANAWSGAAVEPGGELRLIGCMISDNPRGDVEGTPFVLPRLEATNSVPLRPTSPTLATSRNPFAEAVTRYYDTGDFEAFVRSHDEIFGHITTFLPLGVQDYLELTRGIEEIQGPFTLLGAVPAAQRMTSYYEIFGGSTYERHPFPGVGIGGDGKDTQFWLITQQTAGRKPCGNVLVAPINKLKILGARLRREGYGRSEQDNRTEFLEAVLSHTLPVSTLIRLQLGLAELGYRRGEPAPSPLPDARGLFVDILGPSALSDIEQLTHLGFLRLFLT